MKHRRAHTNEACRDEQLFRESCNRLRRAGDLARRRPRGRAPSQRAASQLRDSAGFAPASLLVRFAAEATAYARTVRHRRSRATVVTVTVTVAAAVVAAAALGGCAAPGYDASKVQRELEHAGAPPEQARCVTDAMENRFDLNELGSHSSPTSREVALARAILVKCGVSLSPRR